MKVWIAYKDHSYEGREVLGLFMTRRSALATCQHDADNEWSLQVGGPVKFAMRLRPGKQTHIEWEELGPTFHEGWNGGQKYQVIQSPVSP